jgi:TolB-like protein
MLSLLAGHSLLGEVRSAHAQDLRAGIDQLVQQVGKTVPAGRTLRVAVADFPDLQGVTSDLGRYVASLLTTRLAQDARFAVIERQRLGQVLAELKFSMLDLVDPAKAKQLGRMIGVETLVVGSVTDLGNQVELHARLIEIESNLMLTGAVIPVTKDPTVAALLDRGRTGAGESAQGPSGSDFKGTPEAPGSSPVPAGSIRGFQGLPLGKIIKRQDGLWEVDLASLQVKKDEVEVRIGVTNLDPSETERGFSSKETYLVDDQGHEYRATKVSVIGGSGERVRIPSNVRRVFQILLPLPGPHASRVTWVIGPTMWPAQPIVIRDTAPVR